MKSVCVLLSTYNGEKYLPAQIESLLKQEGIELSVIARDDGSKDGTVELLRYYSNKDSRLDFYKGKNLGVAQSFFNLIKYAKPADYYAFCDQDDIWDSDKLKCAVDFLEKEDNSKPNMYFSNLRIVDQKLTYYRLSHLTPLIQKNKYSALTEDIATGCTIVFNYTAKEYAKSRIPEYCSMHDTWIYMICKFFGKCVYDFNAHISYRQHGNNVVGTYLDKKPVSLYIARINRLFNRKLQPRYNNARNFYYLFGDKLDFVDALKVKELAYYKASLKSRFKLLFDKDINASSWSREICYRILIVLGIV